jgi:thioredoxin 1
MTTGEIMTTDTKLVTITDDNFAAEIESHEGLAMIDFWAAWCGPCRMVAPIVEELAEENADSVKVGKLDVDEHQKTAMKFAVRSIPSILFFKDGRHVDTVVGAVPKAALERKIQQHALSRRGWILP